MTERASSPARFNWRAVFIFGPTVLLLALLVWWWQRPAPIAGGAGAAEPDSAAVAPVAVEIATVAEHPMETTVSAQGILTPGQGASARVAVLATGRLTAVLVREGQHVEAGQLLASVDKRAALSGERSAASALSASEADVRQADVATAVAQNDQRNALEQAQLGLRSAIAENDAAVHQAFIALRSAESDLRKAEVVARAPDASNALQQAQLALKAARLDRDAAVTAAANVLQAAQTDLEKLRAGARPQEIAQAQAAVAQAQATRDRAATEVERVQFLFDKGIKARRELEDAKTALRVAESSLQIAQDQLSLVQAGTRAEDIRAGEVRVSGAREALDAARQSGDTKVQQAQSALRLAQGNLVQATRQRPEDLRSARLKVASARDALRQAEKSRDAKIGQARAGLQAASKGWLQIVARTEDARAKRALAGGKAADLDTARISTESAELRAPLGGIVLKRNLNAGDLADPATPVVEIADTHALNLGANLPAEDGAAVRAGMAARVTTESAPGRTFPAQVVSTGQIAPQSGLMTVRVAVSNVGNGLRIGALANCTIVVERRPWSLAVPAQAVIDRDGKSTVFVAGHDGKAHSREVAAGAEAGGLIEIRRGLRRGEKVIRLGQYELEDGAAVKPAARTRPAPPSGVSP